MLYCGAGSPYYFPACAGGAVFCSCPRFDNYLLRIGQSLSSGSQGGLQDRTGNTKSQNKKGLKSP